MNASIDVSSSRSDVAVIALIGFVHAVSHFFHLVIPVLFPWLMPAFGLSYTQAGALMTIFFAISGLGQALAGKSWLVLAGSVGGSLWLWRSGWVPAEAAAVICTALGGALALAGVLFWVALVRARRRAAREEEHVPDGSPRSETE